MGSEYSTCAAHRAALATVARISFTFAGLGVGLGGCIESPHSVLDAPLDDIEDAADAARDGGGLAAPDAMVDGLVDARVIDAADSAIDGAAVDAVLDATVDAAVDGMSDAVVWSETTPCPSAQDDLDAWRACCEAKDWDWADPNCAAWGPPMPPRMMA